MTKEEIQKNSEHWHNKYKDAEKRIEELEKENKTLEGCLLAEQEHTQILEKQIEKMKCCENCRWLWLKKSNETVTACSSCKDKNMWRLKK